MTAVLSAIAMWGPTLRYSVGIAGALAVPSIIKQGNNSIPAKDAFPAVFEKEGRLRKDIVIQRSSIIEPAYAIGTNFGPAALLIINENLDDADIVNFICKHELSHIKTSDPFISCAIAAAASAISTYTVPFLRSCLPWWAAPLSYGVPYLVGNRAYTLAMIIFELRADRFAHRHATDEELIGWQRFLKVLIEENKSMQPKYPHLFTKDGNSLVDSVHPPLTQRLEAVRRVLQQKKIAVDEASQIQIDKTNKIKEYIQIQYSKVKMR